MIDVGEWSICGGGWLERFYIYTYIDIHGYTKRDGAGVEVQGGVGATHGTHTANMEDVKSFVLCERKAHPCRSVLCATTANTRRVLNSPAT